MSSYGVVGFGSGLSGGRLVYSVSLGSLARALGFIRGGIGLPRARPGCR